MLIWGRSLSSWLLKSISGVSYYRRNYKIKISTARFNSRPMDKWMERVAISWPSSRCCRCRWRSIMLRGTSQIYWRACVWWKFWSRWRTVWNSCARTTTLSSGTCLCSISLRQSSSSGNWNCAQTPRTAVSTRSASRWLSQFPRFLPWMGKLRKPSGS